MEGEEEGEKVEERWASEKEGDEGGREGRLTDYTQ